MFINPKLSEKEQVMDFSMDMTEEQKPTRKKLLPEGWRPCTIIGCSDEKLSKQQNKQYIIRIKDDETGYEDNFYAVSEPKKRWALKNLFDACSIPHQNGVYKFDKPLKETIVGKKVDALYEHEENSYINRENIRVEGKQHRISEFREQEWDKDMK